MTGFDFERKQEEKLQRVAPLKKRGSLIQSIEKKRQSPNVIAEIKRQSPSRGHICDCDLLEAASQMESGGAAAISVLTDVDFGGKLSDISYVKSGVCLPVLCKDFIADSFQLYEAYSRGADAVLLIAALLQDKTSEFVRLAHTIGLDCLVEVHSRSDLAYAIDSGARLIGVNSRDLRTLEVSLDVAEKLLCELPSSCIPVAESGIREPEDLERLRDMGYRGFLIGTGIMLSGNIEENVRRFTGK